MSLVASDDDPTKTRVALALSEASRRIERTEHWELYTEALRRADEFEARYEQMQRVMRATRAERAEIRRLKKAAAVQLVELEQKTADLERLTAERLASTPGEILAETLHAERLSWSRQKATYQEIMRTFTAEQLWQRVRSGTDVY